jgi:hypothetical protein
MSLQNKIKIDITLTTIISFSFLAFAGFIFVFSKSEGTIGDGFIINFIADYIIYLFPSVLLCDYFKLYNPSLLLLLTALNILLYSFILTRLFAIKLLNSKRYKPFSLTVITGYVIPLIILLYIISLIVTSK